MCSFHSIFFLDTNSIATQLPSVTMPHSSFTHFEDYIIQVHHDLDDKFLVDVLEEQIEPFTDPIPLRKFAKVFKPPSYLQAYHCNQVSSIPTTTTLQSGTSHPYPLTFLTILFPLHISFSIVLYLLLLSLPITIKPFLTLNGKKPWLLR